MARRAIGTLLLFCLPALCQSDDLKAILSRLEKLEQQNQELRNEVQALRRQISEGSTATSAPSATLQERVEVQEQRTEELAGTKVQSSQRLPLSVTGMLLFNAYLNGRHNGATEFPGSASSAEVPRTAGGTFRQTVLGLRFESPDTVIGAKIHGAVYMDFFANPPSTSTTDRITSNNLNRLMRLRIATVEMDWGNTNLLIGQDKPIISPREPNSLLQVGISPLTNAGNPWLWQPQIRLEQRFRIDGNSDVRAQGGLFQTSEQSSLLPEVYAPTLESSRPGWEFRLAYSRRFSGDRFIEVAPSYHRSETHVAGTSVPSRVYGIDWSVSPFAKLNFSGMLYRGQNMANLGTIRQGFTVLGPGSAIPIHSLGGWSQLSYTATSRLTFNIYGGQHDDRNRDMRSGAIGKNFAYAGNAMYRIAPNVILALEIMQIRTWYIEAARRMNNHYDLALAYQF